jgi:curved DNA-binding protein
VLKEPDKRAAYDRMGSQWKSGQEFQPPPGWDEGFEFSGASAEEAAQYSDFFETLFGRRGAGAREGAWRRQTMHAQGEDRHARVMIDLVDAYRGARRSIALHEPVVDAQGHVTTRERTLEINIPKGIRAGQHLRLAGLGGPGIGEGPPGDLYLEIDFNPDARFRVDGRDVYLDLPLAPWEAALGAAVTAPTPDGAVQLTIPPGSQAGRRLRLKGKGIPGEPPGDMYAVLTIALPPANTDAAKEAYRAMASAFAFDPRAHLSR